MKTMTIASKRYRLSVREYDGRVYVSGPGLTSGVALPDGVTLDSTDLRAEVQAAIERSGEAHRNAAAYIRDVTSKPGWNQETSP